MTAPSIEDVLAETLAGHQCTTGYFGRDLWRNYACTCGHWTTADTEAESRAHVAAEQAKALFANIAAYRYTEPDGTRHMLHPSAVEIVLLDGTP